MAKAKLTDLDAELIRQLYRSPSEALMRNSLGKFAGHPEGLTMAVIAEKFGVTKQLVWRILTYRSYRRIRAGGRAKT